jgi:uncharacterized membrane protein YeaQ/YmgE (transglycosylase-associated protein family)
MILISMVLFWLMNKYVVTPIAEHWYASYQVRSSRLQRGIWIQTDILATAIVGLLAGVIADRLFYIIPLGWAVIPGVLFGMLATFVGSALHELFLSTMDTETRMGVGILTAIVIGIQCCGMFMTHWWFVWRRAVNPVLDAEPVEVAA